MSEFSDYLAGFTLTFKPTLIEATVERHPKEAGGGRYLRFKWEVSVNGEVFDFETGAHLKAKDWLHFYRVPDRTKYMVPKLSTALGDVYPELPALTDVVYCLAHDGRASEESFAEWCDSFGYDEDSRKALATYLLCQANGIRLRTALRGTGVDFNKLKELEH